MVLFLRISYQRSYEAFIFYPSEGFDILEKFHMIKPSVNNCISF